MADILNPEHTAYLNSLKRDSVFGELENFAFINKIPVIGWNTAEFLELIVTIKNPAKILEIGTAIGYSAIRMLSGCAKNTTIDTIELSRDNIPLAKNNFIKYGVQERIRLLEGNATDILPGLGTYDLVFLDADKKYYISLFQPVLNRLKQGGVLIVDNLLWKGEVASPSEKKKVSSDILREFNKLFLSEETLKSTIIPVGDGIGLAVKL